MKQDFDHTAKNYDTNFTHSEIGKLQRKLVYKQLDTLLKNKNQTVLELNCGTGEDAILLANKGNTVLATDISNEMIKVAKQKAIGIKNLSFKQLDVTEIGVRLLDIRREDSKFDLIFSNFGGLNCINPSEMKLFFENAHKTLVPNGRMMLVIMPKNTLWERVYFILKGKIKTAFRRNTNKTVAVNVENNAVKTWYYNPKNIKNLSLETFKIIKTKPIGFFIPPSYLEPFFKEKTWALHLLYSMEKCVKNWTFLSKYSDHFSITLQRK